MELPSRRGVAGLIVASGAGVWILEGLLLVSLPLVASRMSDPPLALIWTTAWASAGTGSALIAGGLLTFEHASSELWGRSPQSRPSVASAYIRRRAWIAIAAFLAFATLAFGIAREISVLPSLLTGPVVVAGWLSSALLLVTACFAYESFVRRLTRHVAGLDFPKATALRGYSLVNALGISFFSGSLAADPTFRSSPTAALLSLIILVLIPVVKIIASAYLARDGLRFRRVGIIPTAPEPRPVLVAIALSRTRMARETFWSCYLAEPPELVHRRVQARLVSERFRITANVAPHGLTAERRPFNLAILLVLVVVLWPAAVLYYFTRKNNTATVGIQAAGTGSYVEILVEGAKATDLLRLAVASLTVVTSPPRTTSTSSTIV
jgi:hypothetical protein